MEELLEFSPQRNFDFFRYVDGNGPMQKDSFLSDCQEVLKSAHKAVAEIVKLGCRLKKLKDDNLWTAVVDPETGKSFVYKSFEGFCKYAFGFSKTRTSRYLGLAQYAYFDEQQDKLLFRKGCYERMNESQLVELIPVAEWERSYFSEDMSVAEMRNGKKYLDSAAFWTDKQSINWNFRDGAKAWAEKQERRREAEQAQAVTAALEKAALGELPSDVLTVATSQLLEKDDPDFLEEPMALLDSAEEWEDSSALENRFATFAGVRSFLAGFETWERVISENAFFDKIYRYRFKNGIELYAATCANSISLVDETQKTLIYFFLSLGAGIAPIKVAKRKLEIWMRANEAVLL